VVLGLKPVAFEEKLPSPVPLVVFVLKEIVGLEEVLQQIPLAVTATPPLSVTFPPAIALAVVILVTSVVVTAGAVKESVEKEISFP
jgi:hypothetical protein